MPPQSSLGNQKVLVKMPLQVEQIPCYLLRLDEKQTFMFRAHLP